MWNAVLSFLSSSFSASTVIVLLLGLSVAGFQQWRVNCAKDAAEHWKSQAMHQQAATEQLQVEIIHLNTALTSREKELASIVSQRKVDDTKVAEVIRNEDASKSWADTALPDGIRGLLTPAGSQSDKGNSPK